MPRNYKRNYTNMKCCRKRDSIFLSCDLGYARIGLDLSSRTDLQEMSQHVENFFPNILHSSRYGVFNFLVRTLTFPQDVPANDVEYSELILYHIDFLEEQGDLGEALAMLHQYTESGVIMNRLHAATVRPRLLLKLGRTDEAVEVYRALVDRNPDCHESYRDLLKSQDIDLGGLSCRGPTVCIDSSSRCADRGSYCSSSENIGRPDTKIPQGSRTPTISPNN